MKKALMLALFVVAAVFSSAHAQEFDQTLFNDFVQKFQAANTARMAGEYDKAVKLFNECLDEKYATQPALADMQAGVYQLLGMLYDSYLNQRDQALVFYDKALAMLLKKQSVDDPAMAQMNAAGEDRIAATYRLMGDYGSMAAHSAKALEYYDIYWNSPQDYKMKETDFNRTIGADNYYLGLARKGAGDEAAAKESFTKAAQLYETLLAEEHPADIEMMLSYIYRELGEPLKCIEYYQKFLELRGAQPDMTQDARYMLDISRIALAYYLFDAGRYDESLAEAKKVITAAEAINWTSDLWRALSLTGRANEKLGDKSAALEAYKKAIEVIESQRGGLGAGDDRAAFLEKHIGVYCEIIRLLIDMGNADEALNYLERSKARSFLDMLGGRNVGARAGAEKDVVDKQFALQKEINGLSMSMMSGGQGARGGGAPTVERGAKLRDARVRYASLMLKVKEMNPEFSSLVTVAPPSTADVSALLGDAVALEYFPSDDKLFIWVVKKTGATLRMSDVPAKALENQVKMLRSKITRGTIDDSYVNGAQKLYETLIAPVEDLLPASGGNLVIVPHGALHYLPFNTLMKGDAYLIDNYIVTLSPSLGAIKYMLAKTTPNGKRLLALGDPLTELPALPAAREEVETIKGGFKSADIFVGENAVESLLSGPQAAKADEIHIASHGLFAPDKPMLSALVLSPSKDDTSDGLLQVHEIFGLKLSEANLVTLSACETGLSSISAGDELVGLSRAFIYAGAPRVVVSLWSVNDVSTGELMKNFYTANVSPAAALRDAQLKLKSNPDFAHPFFWAPFQLIGDWR